MALEHYGVLRGRVVGQRPASGDDGHFHLHVVAGETDHRVAINVESKQEPSELEYLIDADFGHPILDGVAALPTGWSPLASEPGGVALDFIRSELFDRDALRKLPFDLPGPDNDLNEKLADQVRRAIADEHATIFAFGEPWGPEPGNPDRFFGFEPGRGVHDIHMNQANVERFEADDGVYQDGALLLHFPEREQWVATFLKFQSQTWQSDDVTGHRLTASRSRA